MIDGQLNPTEGLIRRNSHLKIGRYHQHLAEELDLNLSALEYMQQEYPAIKEVEEMRRIIGRYGLTGRNQTCPMKNLSDGQRCRVCFGKSLVGFLFVYLFWGLQYCRPKIWVYQPKVLVYRPIINNLTKSIKSDFLVGITRFMYQIIVIKNL